MEGQVTSRRVVIRRHESVRCLLATAMDADVRVAHSARPDGSGLMPRYDDLIVGVGVKQPYVGHDEFAEHSSGMKALEDAPGLRRTIYRAFDTAEACDDPQERAAWLTFAPGPVRRPDATSPSGSPADPAVTRYDPPRPV